jgi:hypothetical protein
MSERKKAKRPDKKEPKEARQTMGLGAHGAAELPEAILKSYIR